jgi:NDP-sugar pyrophosphorylase family protein
MKAIVLAGGRGTRLRPYTAVLPKPLMPVGDRPILEIVIRQLAEAGIEEVILAVGYLAELIMAYCESNQRMGVPISYVRENEPLGTAGPLALARDQIEDTFLVINGDVLSDVNFKSMVAHHRAEDAPATVGVTKRQAHIDFGVVELDSKGRLGGWREKPVLDYIVSMGIYVFEPGVLAQIQPGAYLDLPSLVLKLTQAGQPVSTYLHTGYWLDIGRPEDHQIANRDVERIIAGHGDGTVD